MIEHKPITEFLKNISITLNGIPFLFNFVCNKKFTNPIDFFCYILSYKTIDLYMQFYNNIVDNHPISFDENRHLYFQVNLLFENFSMDFQSYRFDVEKNMIYDSISYQSITEEDIKLYFQSMISHVNSKHHQFKSFYNTWLPEDTGNRLTENFLKEIEEVNQNWKFFYIEPKFNFISDNDGNQYYDHLGNDSCTLIYTDTCLLVLLTQGTD